MQVFAAEQALPPEWQGGVVAIGNFDGLHRGHQALIQQTLQRARELGCKAGILTFEPHPRQFFQPDQTIFRLTPEPLKLALAERLGLDFAAILKFDGNLAGLSAQEFVQAQICDRLAARHVVTGHDFRFGKARAGDAEFLRKAGENLDFGVSIVEAVGEGEEIFSSSRIRAHLAQGEVEAAAKQLGAWWRIAGRVVQGDQRGRTIGYPTANVAIEPGMAAAEGIYAARVFVRGRWQKGAAYIGARPTFDTLRRFLEIYLLDFSDDIYGEWLEAELVCFIRPDQKFDGLDGLLQQMRADCDVARERLNQLDVFDPYPNLRPAS